MALLPAAAGELSALSTRDLVQAEKISAACREKGIDLIAPGDQAYPNRLWEIPNPPALLYCQGVLPDLEEALCLAAVGTRSATEDGMKSAFELCYRLAGAGTVIVSGGALGADQAALEGALQAKGKTIAVLGGGADVDYPPNFAGMRKRILETAARFFRISAGNEAYRAISPSATGLFQDFPGESW